MEKILLILTDWQKDLLFNVPTHVTIAPNYLNINIEDFFLIIDATNQWENNITTSKQWVVHQPIKLNNTLPENAVRFNAWQGFFNNSCWEFSGQLDQIYLDLINQNLQKKLIPSADKAGLISARIIAGIINEAYNTFEQKISNKDDIDTAMKLGTNYPFGPFEWAEKIGLNNVKELLLAKQQENPAYIPNALILNN